MADHVMITMAHIPRGTTAATALADMRSISKLALARVHGGYSPELFAQMQTAVSMGLTINSTWTGNHGSNQAHYDGRAFDSVGTPAQMQRFYDHALTTNPHEVIYRDNYIEDGRRRAPVGGHYTHIHYSALKR